LLPLFQLAERFVFWGDPQRQANIGDSVRRGQRKKTLKSADFCWKISPACRIESEGRKPLACARRFGGSSDEMGMDEEARRRHSALASQRRRVGRPTTLENGGPSLAVILSLLRAGALTRLDIERKSGLGRAAVADRLATLKRLGLIEEGELGRPQGGRAPRHVRLRENAGAFLVAHIDRMSLAVGLANLSGHLIVEHHEAADLALGPEPILDRLMALFYWLLDERGGKEAAWAIALALPEAALVDANDGDTFGIATLHVLRAWRTFDFASELSLHFGAPTFARSNTQMMTLGEMKAGAGLHVDNLVCVRIDRSVSAGVVSGGRLHAGAHGLAGLVGHAPTGEAGDVPCHCGAKGCLDAVASAEAVERAGLLAATDGRSRHLADVMARHGDVTANDIGHGAQLGDAFCAELLSRSGRLIGESLAPIVNLLNPAVVVLAGALAHSGEILLAAVRETIYGRSHPLATRDLRIVRSQLAGSAELVGAGSHAAEQIFASARGWVPLGSPRREPSFLTFLTEAKIRRHRASAMESFPPANLL
jgi:predicted NBD/HSP70 family sugar kinase